MPRYNYVCKDCLAAAEKKLGRTATEDEYNSLLFETSHAMFPTTKEKLEMTQCPFCEGHNTVQSLCADGITIRIRHSDWREFRKKNASALQRDMALHQLQNDDPYGYMRPAGDKADLIDKLRDGRKKKTQKKHFLT
jgi:hypothetical protein